MPPPLNIRRSDSMGMPVKLSDELVLHARQEAERADRSITAQFEHWAKLGRAVEVALGYQQTSALKQPAGDIRDPGNRPAKRKTVLAILEHVAASSDRTDVIDAVRKGGQPVFGTDPAFPGMTVRLDPDGTRTPGRLMDRRFVAANAPATNAAKATAKRKARSV